MMNGKVHILKSDAEAPQRFTYPFCYKPHPLCLAAAGEVRHYLNSRPEWQQELARGKMLGVLVVQEGESRGFLSAFSGTLDGKTQHEYFVPPVYDLMEPGCHFQQEQERISAINHQIEELRGRIAPNSIAAEAEHAIRIARERMQQAKAQRDALRSAFSDDELKAHQPDFIHQSQFLKAELKRTKSSGHKKCRRQKNQMRHYASR